MVAALAALTLAAPGYAVFTTASSVATEPVGGTFNALPATRVYDTSSGIGGRSTPLNVYETVSVPLAGVADVPISGAAAVAVDITVMNAPGNGHLTVWPSGTTRPSTSTINVSTGQTMSNFAIVPLGADGSIDVYDSIGGGTVDIAVDVHGWISAITDSQAPGRFIAVTPSRLVDTRNGTGGRTGALASGESWTLSLDGVGGIASNAGAAALNITVVSATSAGSITVHASDVTRPAAATVDYPGNTTVASFAMATMGATGDVTFYNSGPSTAHLVIDVQGYLTAGTNTQRGGMFELLTPARVIDTRNGTGGRSTPLNSGETFNVTVRGQAGVPSSSSAAGTAIVAVTSLGATTSGSFTLFASGTTRPTTSIANFNVGTIRAGFALVPIGTDGKVSVYNASSGTVHLLFDILGYITPVTSNQAPSAPGSLSPTANATVSDGTPTLSATVTDPDSDRMTTSWTVQDTTTTTTTVVDNAAGYNAESGTSTTFDVAPGLILNGHSYQWRVAACDGTACTTSAWSTFTASGINSIAVEPQATPSSNPNTACTDDPDHDPNASCVAGDDSEGPPMMPAPNYYGYTGQDYNTGVTNSVVVLPYTVRVKATTAWSASGMVRNQLNQVGAEDVVVTATLKDVNSVTLGTATTTITEFNIRPGEPAPFTVTSSIPASSVDNGKTVWSATATTTTAPVERQLTSTVLWQAAYAERDPVDLGYYTETAPNPPAPLPHLIFGEVTNAGTTTYTSGRVIGAWVDTDGGVIETFNVPLTDSAGTPSGLYAGQNAQFLVVASSTDAALLSESEVVMWQVAE